MQCYLSIVSIVNIYVVKFFINFSKFQNIYFFITLQVLSS